MRRFPNGPSLFLFVFFIVVALLTVLVLEYLDYRGGRYSFIFTHLIKPKAPKARTATINQDLVQLLKRNSCEFQYLKDAAGTFHFKISTESGQHAALEEQIKNLVNSAGGRLQLIDSQKSKEEGLFLYRITFAKNTTHMLLLSTAESKQKPQPEEKKPPGQAPRIAFIIDDIGYTTSIADQLHNLGIPITAAIIPDAPYAGIQAEKIHRFGLEEIIHLPMQSKNSQNHHPADQFVTTASTPPEIAALLGKARRIIPHARGLNNHMGSLITSSQEWIGRVLQEVKRERLFFIDSRTSQDSIAFETAKAMNIKTVCRDVFLDGIQTYSHSREQIRQLVEMAQSRGEAVAIGHPLDTTMKALQDSLEWIKSQKVEIVFVSALLK